MYVVKSTAGAAAVVAEATIFCVADISGTSSAPAEAAAKVAK